MPWPILGRDPRLLAILDTVARIADTDATVLIQGESGTGKELVARSIHRESGRCDGPFVAVNCGAVAESLLESEIFGHERGAFTGAEAARVGRFEAAHGGTIFLDELSEMGRPLQVALLRLLQSGEFTPVGGTASRYTDARVVAATNTDLARLVQAGQFRGDLYYRLNIVRIELPPLRARRDDILLLAEHFLQSYGANYGRPCPTLGGDAQEYLLAFDFPGNVRQLESIIHRAVILCRGDTIRAADLPEEVVKSHPAPAASAPSTSGYHEARACNDRDFDVSYLTSVLREAGGIVSRAARIARLSPRNFHKKLARYQIDFKEFRR